MPAASSLPRGWRRPPRRGRSSAGTVTAVCRRTRPEWTSGADGAGDRGHENAHGILRRAERRTRLTRRSARTDTHLSARERAGYVVRDEGRGAVGRGGGGGGEGGARRAPAGSLDPQLLGRGERV